MLDERADPMVNANERTEVLARVAEAQVQLVDLQFSDIVGGAKALTIPVELLPWFWTRAIDSMVRL